MALKYVNVNDLNPAFKTSEGVWCFLDGVNIGLFEGAATFEEEVETLDTQANQFGTLPYETVTTGSRFKLTVDLLFPTETIMAKLSRSIQLSQYGDTSGVNSVGESLRDLGGPMKLVPSLNGSPDPDESRTTNIYFAYPIGMANISYEPGAHRKMSTEFMIVSPDEMMYGRRLSHLWYLGETPPTGSPEILWPDVPASTDITFDGTDVVITFGSNMAISDGFDVPGGCMITQKMGQSVKKIKAVASVTGAVVTVSAVNPSEIEPNAQTTIFMLKGLLTDAGGNPSLFMPNVACMRVTPPTP